MNIKIIDGLFSICKIEDINIKIDNKYSFLSITDDEISLVCKNEFIPSNYTDIEKDYRCFKIEGNLDFSLVGIISRISKLLADSNIPIFVISTFNTDYFLVKDEYYERVKTLLKLNNYKLI